MKLGTITSVEVFRSLSYFIVMKLVTITSVEIFGSLSYYLGICIFLENQQNQWQLFPSAMGCACFAEILMFSMFTWTHFHCNAMGVSSRERGKHENFSKTTTPMEKRNTKKEEKLKFFVISIFFTRGPNEKQQPSHIWRTILKQMSLVLIKVFLSVQIEWNYSSRKFYSNIYFEKQSDNI